MPVAPRRIHALGAKKEHSRRSNVLKAASIQICHKLGPDYVSCSASKNDTIIY